VKYKTYTLGTLGDAHEIEAKRFLITFNFYAVKWWCPKIGCSNGEYFKELLLPTMTISVEIF
jgi:hypothetical protein